MKNLLRTPIHLFIQVCVFLLLYGISLNVKSDSVAKDLSTQHTHLIPYESMIKDLTYLASDELKGRGNFSSEINDAASYIAQRFQKIGLQPLPNQQDFYQNFTLINKKPKSISITINEHKLPLQRIAYISHASHKYWDSTQQINIKYIGKTDNFRQHLQTYNQQGGEYLIIVHPAHQVIFQHYQDYFNQGKTTIYSEKKENNQSLILVLSNITNVAKININLTTSQTLFNLKNVIGVLPAVTKNTILTDLLLFSAHYDHLGINTKNQEIYNGADDNASGTTAVIQLAQFYATQNTNNRPLIFAAFAAEELGILGSQYFSQHIDSAKITAMFNIEMIGKKSKFGAGKVWMTGYNKSDLFNLLNQGSTEDDLMVYPDPYPEQSLFYRSDNAPFARLGVPAHSFSSSEIDKDTHHHQTTDELNSLNLFSMHQVIENLAFMTQALAQGYKTPARIKTNILENSGKIF